WSTANNNRNPVRSIVLDFPKTLRVSTPKPVEPPGVAAQYRFFVGHAQIVACQQLIDLPATFLGIENFVGKIAAENKRVGARFLNGKPKTVVIDIKADKDSPLAHLAPEVIAGLLAFFRPSHYISFQVDLEMTPMVGTVEAIKKQRHPGRAPREACRTQFWEGLEYTVRQHASACMAIPNGCPSACTG